jgi:hypothetical protein
MIGYSKNHHPAASVLEVTVSNVVNRRLRRALPALLDTGSDVSALPEFCLSPLKLYPVAEIQLEGIETKRTIVFLYAVRLTLAGILIERQEIVLTKLNFAVIGRDVLNRFDLHLYGPPLAFEISK